jgi:hypothetical protein
MSVMKMLAWDLLCVITEAPFSFQEETEAARREASAAKERLAEEREKVR